MSNSKLLETGNSTQDYYKSINKTYRKVFQKLLMLHYPFYNKDNESLEDRQINLTNHCIKCIGDLENKNVLEVGCGNGTQSIYIHENFRPGRMTGIDINSNNIALAESINGHHEHLQFHVDDAQQLAKVPDDSVDALICIESAFHYPDKGLFMRQINRVLKPGGKFLIADILSRSYKNRYFMEKWKRKMSYHHWTEKDYLATFKNNELDVLYQEDITQPVMQGYSGYSKWIRRKDFNSLFDFLWIKTFIFIQVKLNMLLLKRRRKYFIFVGETGKNKNKTGV